ncbi:MAG: ABC transporter substrate-binding protein [Candidatus Heimdallarchaeota archaeon]|nr:ABC transporter substrate-binding protein [Candidatus Heimdallarchaeota archaeon]
MKNFKFKLGLAVFLTLSVLMVAPEMVKSSSHVRPTIPIGALGPEAITPGQDNLRGVQLAVEEINAGDGISVSGVVYDFEIFSRTTSGVDGLPDVTTAKTNYALLEDTDLVITMIGGFRTEVVSQLEFSINTSMIPFLGVGSTAPIITEYYYRVGPVNGTTLARNLIAFYLFEMQAKGVLNVTIVREDAAWTQAISAGVQGTLMTGGLLGTNFTFGTDIVISEAASGTDVANALTPLVGDGDLHAILPLFSAPVGRSVSEQWAALGLSDDIYMAGINVEAQRGDHFANTEGGAAGEIFLEAAPLGVNVTEGTFAFKAAYKAKHGSEPTYTSFAAYDAVYVLKEAIERANSFTPANIHAELPNTDYNGTTSRIKFTSESSAGQVASTSVPESLKVFNNTIAHDLFTTSTIGVAGFPWSQVYFSQWTPFGSRNPIWAGTSTGYEAIDAPPYIEVSTTVTTVSGVETTITGGVTTVIETETVDTPTLTVGLVLMSTIMVGVFVSRLRRKNK